MEAGGSTSRGLGIIAADSGALVAALDFEVYQYLDGPGGGPVWLNAREALVTQISGGAPTIVGVDGSVTSALDRFRMSQFVAAAEDPGLPQGVEVDAHLSAAGDRFHVVTSSPVEAATGNPVILIYHSELDEVEQLPASATGGAFMRPDGTVELYDTSDDASRLLRNVDPPGAPAIEGPKNACARRRWYASVSPPDERPYVAETRTEDTVAIYRWPDCATPVRTVRIAGLQDERIGSVTVSPDGRQLAISVGHTYPWRALYIAEVDAGGQ
jgi:hypothetical protein